MPGLEETSKKIISDTFISYMNKRRPSALDLMAHVWALGQEGRNSGMRLLEIEASEGREKREVPKTMGPSHVTHATCPRLPRWLRGWGSQSTGNSIGVLWLTPRRVRAGERGQRVCFNTLSTLQGGAGRGLEQLKGGVGEDEDRQRPANAACLWPF